MSPRGKGAAAPSPSPAPAPATRPPRSRAPLRPIVGALVLLGLYALALLAMSHFRLAEQLLSPSQAEGAMLRLAGALLFVALRLTTVVVLPPLLVYKLLAPAAPTPTTRGTGSEEKAKSCPAQTAGRINQRARHRPPPRPPFGAAGPRSRCTRAHRPPAR